MNVVDWAEEHWRLANGELVKLRPWQRKALLAMFPEDGSAPQAETFLVSTVKKAGKTETTAIATAYAALTFPAPETVYVVANDLEQAQDRVFERIVRAFRAMGLEQRGEVAITRTEVFFLTTGTRIVAVPADFAGAAGAVFGVTSWTELWGYRHEGHVRLWEELTPIPNRRSLRIVDSYAGFTGDAPVLEPLWARALAGERVDDDPPISVSGKLWALIDQGEEAQARGWLGDPADMAGYYAEQAATLRPGTYNRLHLNQWQAGEEAFITGEAWDALAFDSLAPLVPRQTALRLSVGVDAATKRDCAAVVAVAREGARVRLCAHRIWTPRPGDPVDLEKTVEAFLLLLHEQFTLAAVRFDPYQFQRSAVTLRKAGLPMVEFPQTTGNLTAATENLDELVRFRNLVLYPDAELRQHALNAVVVESARGRRLAKERSSRKIDGIAALSFACLGAVRDGGAGGGSQYCGACGRPSTGEMCGCRFEESEGPVTHRAGLELRGDHHRDRPPPSSPNVQSLYAGH